jgi:hypothetical protein
MHPKFDKKKIEILTLCPGYVGMVKKLSLSMLLDFTCEVF